MARIALNCSCGWNFFIPGSTPGHEVTCPSCAQTVRIPGRKPGKDMPITAGEIAAQKQRQQGAIRLMIGAGLAVAVAAGVILAFTMGSKPPEEPGANEPKDRGGLINNSGVKPKQPSRPGTLLSDEPPAPPPAPGPIYNNAQVQQLRHTVMSNIWLINMTTLVSEVMRYRNLTNEWAQFQAEIARYDANVKYNLGELAKVGEKMALEAYLQAGDQVLGFNERDYTTMKPGEVAGSLHTWINSWQAGPGLNQLTVSRAGTRITFVLEFPEATTELLNLVRHPALAVEGTPGSRNVMELVAIPPDLLKNVTSGFDALPPGYRSYLIPADRTRLEEMLLNKKGSSDDVEWMRSRIQGEALPSFQREAEMIRSKILELEPKLKDTGAVDVLYKKNGTKLEGQIVGETETEYKLKTRFGAVPILKEEVGKVEKGKGSSTEFPKLYAAAKGDLVKLVSLLAWCAERTLKFEKEYVAYTILTLDASHEKARTAVGLARPSVGPGQGPAPLKSPAGDGGGGGNARIEAVDRTVEIIANDVTARNAVFTDVVTEMRRRTESLTTSLPPMAPAKSTQGATLIGNPLTFKPNDLTVPTAMEIGSWWSKLSAEERRAFAKYYGLWCAYTRALSK